MHSLYVIELYLMLKGSNSMRVCAIIWVLVAIFAVLGFIKSTVLLSTVIISLYYYIWYICAKLKPNSHPFSHRDPLHNHRPQSCYKNRVHSLYLLAVVCTHCQASPRLSLSSLLVLNPFGSHPIWSFLRIMFPPPAHQRGTVEAWKRGSVEDTILLQPCSGAGRWGLVRRQGLTLG